MTDADSGPLTAGSDEQRQTPEEIERLLSDIDVMIEAQHIKDHPLVIGINRGTVSPSAVRGFAQHFYYMGPEPNPRPQCAIYAHAPDDPLIDQLIFKDIILEEGAGLVSETDAHKRLYFDFCEALGVDVERMLSVGPIPECLAMNQWRYFHAMKGDWLAAVAGVSFIEGPSARRNDLLVEGFVRHYGLESGSTGMRFWELHASEVEEHHGDVGPSLVRRYASTRSLREHVLRTVRGSIDLQWLAFDGMYRAFVDGDPRYARWQ